VGAAGPVAIGDGIGYTDAELVLRSCTAISGTLLQPSRPATSIDACFFEAAFGSGGPVANKSKNYPVWSTHTQLSVSGAGGRMMKCELPRVHCSCRHVLTSCIELRD
jgi:hypothetical protein